MFPAAPLAFRGAAPLDTPALGSAQIGKIEPAPTSSNFSGEANRPGMQTHNTPVCSSRLSLDDGRMPWVARLSGPLHC